MIEVEWAIFSSTMHMCFSSSTTWFPPRDLFLNVVNIAENVSKDDIEPQQLQSLWVKQGSQ